jgi:Holliday junction resolvase RusA-like endonuclease
LAKLVLDALNGVAWLDDGQVVDLTVSKRYAKPDEAEGVTLWVRCWRAKYGDAPC